MKDWGRLMSANAGVSNTNLTFKNLNVKQPGEDVGLHIDWESSGPDKGHEKSRLIVVKEDGGFSELAKDKESRSVMRVTASAYLFCCCFYNCCFCFLPKRLVGIPCTDKFCCKYATQCEIRMRRDRWLGFMHLLCFGLHALMTYLTLSAGAGKPMEIAIFRIKPAWNNTGRNGYNYEVVEDFDLRIDYITGLFFGFSAFFHLIWVVPSFCSPRLWSLMTSYIDDCFCPWYAERCFCPIAVLFADLVFIPGAQALH